MQLSHYLAVLAFAASAAAGAGVAPATSKAVHHSSPQKVLHHSSPQKVLHHHEAAMHHKAAAAAAPQHSSVPHAVHHDAAALHHVAHKLGKMEMHNISNNLHLLASHFHQESAVVEKAAVKMQTPEAIAASMDHMVADIKASMDKTTAKLHKALVQLEKRDVAMPQVDIATVREMFAKVPGCDRLTALLSTYEQELPEGVEADVVSVVTNVDLVKAMGAMVYPASFFTAVVGMADSVTLLQALQGLREPAQFVSAIVAVDSVPALIQAAREDVPDIGALVGSAKLVKYVDAHGAAALVTLARMSGAQTLLSQIKAVTGSEMFVSSLANVNNVEAMVNGLRAVPDMDQFITAVHEVQHIVDIEGLLDGLSQTTSLAGLRRNTKEDAHTIHAQILPNTKMLKLPKSTTLENALHPRAHTTDKDSMVEITTAITAVNKQLAHMTTHLSHMLHKLESSSPNTADTATAKTTLASLHPHLQQFSQTLTAITKHAAAAHHPQHKDLLRVTKTTDSLLAKLAHLS